MKRTSQRFLALIIPDDGMDRVGARAISWGITVAVAFFPAFVGSDYRFSLNLFALAAAANDKGYFHDFLFAGMVISVFSFFNLWDSFSVREKNAEFEYEKFWKFFARLIFAFYIIVLIYGMTEYRDIREKVVSGDELIRVVWLLITVLIVSLGTEVMIALTEVKKELRLKELQKKEQQLHDLLKNKS
jgi:predicted ferric reductase